MGEGQHPQPLRPLIGVALVLGLVALVLGAGLVLRQAGAHPSALVVVQTPEGRRATAAPGSTVASVPTSTVVLAVAVPAATGTPTVAAARPVRTLVAQQIMPARAPELELEKTPQPLVIGTLQTPPRHVETLAALPTPDGAAPAPEGTLPPPESGGDQSTMAGGTYTGLPVAVPATAVLDGAELPVGPAGVRSDGARAFALALLGRARAQDAGLVEDLTLRQVAEQALVDALTISTPTGRVVPTRLRQGSITVQVDIVATLPVITGASLRVFPSASAPAIGVAVGVAGRVEPDYLPDLVAVTAIAYR
ncbi:MAG: hypothetical protein M3069_32325 [Chloroflexota bacterium]|nr:hypothetical protein [Chloroflexota bacterium]